jgi:hypothetical protein
MPNRTEIDEMTRNARGIAWDTCHKIYIILDDEEMEKMRGYGYDCLISADEMTPEQMTWQVLAWYRESCELRFIDTCSSKDGIAILVGQGA